jgi:hypothetical protein
MSHTPGPWRCEEVFVSDEYVLTPTVEDPDYPGERFWVHGDADARLIAAAPDLLAALALILDTAEVPHPLSGREPTVPLQVLETARAVIAKATGEGG